MSLRASGSANRHVIDSPASPEETERLFGVGKRRAAKLDRWVREALALVDGELVVASRSSLKKRPARRVSVNAAKRRTTKSVKKA